MTVELRVELLEALCNALEKQPFTVLIDERQNASLQSLESALVQ